MNSYRGINWGEVSFGQTAFLLQNRNDSKKNIIDIDYTSIKNLGLNRNDLFIEIEQQQFTKEKDSVCQIRFACEVPKKDEPEENQNQEDSKIKNSEESPNQRSDCQIFIENIRNQLMKKSKVNEVKSKLIIAFDDVSLVAPRGKYTLDIYEKNIRFHGLSYSFTIGFKNILKGFILPMENQTQVSIVLQLHENYPIYHGSTMHRFIVLQLKKSVEVEVSCNQSNCPENVKLEKQYNGPLYKILIDVFKQLVKLTLIAPDLSDFKTRSNKQSCVKCSIKAQNGYLYFLKKSLIFIHKPVLYFKIQDIRKVEFERFAAVNRQFDIKIVLKNQAKPIEFIGIDKIQMEVISQYFESKGVNIKIESAKVEKQEVEEDSEDDDDFQADQQQSDDADFEDQSSDEQVSGKGSQKKKKK